MKSSDVEVKLAKPPGHHSEGLQIVRGDNRNDGDTSEDSRRENRI